MTKKTHEACFLLFVRNGPHGYIWYPWYILQACISRDTTALLYSSLSYLPFPSMGTEGMECHLRGYLPLIGSELSSN